VRRMNSIRLGPKKSSEAGLVLPQLVEGYGIRSDLQEKSKFH